MVIIAGHTRREASILAGLDRVPYIVRDDLTPEQVKAYRIADNKLAELSNWDDELLKKELFELQAVDYSLGIFWMCVWMLLSMVIPPTRIYRKFAKWYRKSDVSIRDLDEIFY